MGAIPIQTTTQGKESLYRVIERTFKKVYDEGLRSISDTKLNCYEESYVAF